MTRSDFRTPRLFVAGPLAGGATVTLDRAQANYLVNVLRLKAGDPVLVFDGRSGEFSSTLAEWGRKGAALVVAEPTRAQTPKPDLHYLFAPLKHARLDYMVQKAVEMGAGLLRPVITDHTQISRINLDRARLNVVEAAEQCGVLAVPDLRPEICLDALLGRWADDEPDRRLIVCDEGEESQNPLPILQTLSPGPLAVLVGPEGGFSARERNRLRALSFVTAIPLGPRVLRADTAAVAALAVVQAVLGDWR